jgi:glycine reductase
LIEVAEFEVEAIGWGERSGWDAGILTVARSDLDQVARQEQHVEGVDAFISHPGESTRINGVIDVIEPRAKLAPASEATFPGIAGGRPSCGSGRTAALRGMTVMTVGQLPELGQTFVQEDCLVDMTGPGAAFSPFSSLPNLTVITRMSPGASDQEMVIGQRNVGIRVARFLAGLVGEKEPSEVVRYGTAGAGAGARVVYVCSLISEGVLHDTLLYGSSTEELEPRWIQVEELIDGALVSTDVHYANQRTPTYLYQRNPIIEALHREPALEMVGVILTLRYGSHDEKQKAAQRVAKLAGSVEAEAVITHPAVGGNAHVDALEIVEEAEKAGIRTVLVLQEMAGERGADFGLVHVVPDADALVSSGNRDEVVELPALHRTVGNPLMRDGSSASGTVTTSLRSFLCSTAQVGMHRLTTVAG